MEAKEFKQKVKKALNSEINFAGHVDLVINNITEDKQKIILNWIKECCSGIKRPEPCKNFRHLISFIYKSSDNKIRGILTKEKNAYFVELFLDKHKYYDRKRKYLGI
ncbi:MAG: hypothetical protein KAU20_00850 [Nanoarchaeota archaeon]|nr:hypothetical protein [Nanoarchaeota archaeon]